MRRNLVTVILLLASAGCSSLSTSPAAIQQYANVALTTLCAAFSETNPQIKELCAELPQTEADVEDLIHTITQIVKNQPRGVCSAREQ